ncbi:hypothetical protein AB1N83_014015 [Pleurotus pulmonarius]
MHHASALSDTVPGVRALIRERDDAKIGDPLSPRKWQARVLKTTNTGARLLTSTSIACSRPAPACANASIRKRIERCALARRGSQLCSVPIRQTASPPVTYSIRIRDTSVYLWRASQDRRAHGSMNGTTAVRRRQSKSRLRTIPAVPRGVGGVGGVGVCELRAGMEGMERREMSAKFVSFVYEVKSIWQHRSPNAAMDTTERLALAAQRCPAPRRLLAPPPGSGRQTSTTNQGWPRPTIPICNITT